MKLEDWLILHDLTQQEFAEVIGVSQTTISRLLADPARRKPGWEILQAIIKATDGAVTANDFFEIEAAE